MRQYSVSTHLDDDSISVQCDFHFIGNFDWLLPNAAHFRDNSSISGPSCIAGGISEGTGHISGNERRREHALRLFVCWLPDNRAMYVVIQMIEIKTVCLCGCKRWLMVLVWISASDEATPQTAWAGGHGTGAIRHVWSSHQSVGWMVTKSRTQGAPLVSLMDAHGMLNKRQIKFKPYDDTSLSTAGERDGLRRREEWSFLLGTVLTKKTKTSSNP